MSVHLALPNLFTFLENILALASSSFTSQHQDKPGQTHTLPHLHQLYTHNHPGSIPAHRTSITMPAPALERDGNSSGEKMSRFFEMPPELRNEVYSYLGTTARLNRKKFDMVSLISAELDHCPSTSLLVVSKQFSTEYSDELKRVTSTRTLTLDFGRTGRPGTTGTTFSVEQMLGQDLTWPYHKSWKRLMENSQMSAAMASVSCLRVSIDEHNVVLSCGKFLATKRL